MLLVPYMEKNYCVYFNNGGHNNLKLIDSSKKMGLNKLLIGFWTCILQIMSIFNSC